jgi:hypothetical protein
MGAIEFTDNYQDLSTDKGFQFKFCCERCGNGYMSTYKLNKLGVAGGLLDAASSIFGGILGRAAHGAYDIQRAVGGKAHDEGLREAVEEIRPKFIQCRKCGQWICREICFNDTANMCKQCAPIAEEVETSIRAEHVQTQVANDLFLEENKRMSAKGKEVAAKCAKCGEPTLGKKFCPSCGAPVAAGGTRFCPSCGAKAAPGAKFCGECGAKMGQ